MPGELPVYRKIVGHIKWLPTGGYNIVLDKVIDDSFKLRREEPTESVNLNVTAGIDWIIAAAQDGYSESTGEKEERYISSRNRNIEMEKIKHYSNSSFQSIIQSIENLVFRFVSESYSLLCYGDALQDVWQTYRTDVDSHLTKIGLGGHLDAIRTGLSSTNPPQWRTAMWSCRDLLHDLADYLWQDPRKTYDALPGKEGKLKVTKNNYINRLFAYLHYKGTTGEIGSYLRSEMERISHSIDTLNDLDSKAHDVIGIRDVRTAAIGTYIIIGELVNRTDMEPVKDYLGH